MKPGSTFVQPKKKCETCDKMFGASGLVNHKKKCEKWSNIIIPNNDSKVEDFRLSLLRQLNAIYDMIKELEIKKKVLQDVTDQMINF